jgi:choline dehydrogenase-like flavoprotein
MIQGIRFGREIAKQPALAAWIEKELCPGPDLVDDAALAEYIKHTSNTVYHPAGTCKIGADTDRFAVINTEFKVRGVEGLRIADASIFPHMIGVNPNLTVMMIAERCARLVVQEAHRHLAETAQRPELTLPA